jgi:pimeloyl-ACP methyl ester carboxylesterase
MGAGIAIRAANLAATDFQGNTSENKGISIAGVIAFAPYSTLRSPIPARLALQNLPAWPFAPIAFLTLRILGRMDGPLEKDARELRAPLLVMAGDHDPISPLADAQKISSAAPSGTLNVLPYQRHDDLRLGDAQQFDRALANFLNSITEP